MLGAQGKEEGCYAEITPFGYAVDERRPGMQKTRKGPEKKGTRGHWLIIGGTAAILKIQRVVNLWRGLVYRGGRDVQSVAP